MNARKTIVGLCLLCALGLSAVAAQGAMAASNGTTLFTCLSKSPGGAGFSKEHCRTEDAVFTGAKYEHAAFSEETTTRALYTSAKTNPETTGNTSTVFKETIAGVELELKAGLVTGEGSLTNKKDPTTGEHYFEGTALLQDHEVAVLKPAGKGCKVFTDETATKTKGAEGAIDWHISFTSKGQGDRIRFEPSTGGAFTSYFVECTTKIPAIEGTWELTGAFTCPMNGATIECTHADTTAQNGLKGKGSKAGYEGKLTVSGKDELKGDPDYTPLSPTTVATP
jgi:hypothetical protein